MWVEKVENLKKEQNFLNGFDSPKFFRQLYTSITHCVIYNVIFSQKNCKILKKFGNNKT